MRRILSFLFLFFQFYVTYTQSWNLLSDRPTINEEIDFKPMNSLLFQINDNAIKTILWQGDHENDVNLDRSNSTISLPTADGKMHQFRFVQYEMMEYGLSKKFPEFRTYYGVDEDDPYTSVRMDYTLRGFRAVISELDKSTYIEYYDRKDNNKRLIYYRHDYPNIHDWQCHFESDKKNRYEERSINAGARVGDCVFRSYRLANAATGEYTAFHGGTNPVSTWASLSQAAIVTAINRVNQVYEFDFAVRLILVSNNINIVYTNGATDPYTNDDGLAMLDENVATCNSLIGSANFDVGHVFSTGGGGVAGLGVVCSASKAEGVTGLPSPTGDPFYIDYVAHEMGHQFGDF